MLRVWEHALQKKDRSALVRRLRQVLGNRFQIMNCGMQRNHEAGHQSFSQLLHHPCSEGFLPVCSVFRGEAVALVMGAGDVETWREDGAKRLFPYKQHLISLGESNPSGVLHE